MSFMVWNSSLHTTSEMPWMQILPTGVLWSLTDVQLSVGRIEKVLVEQVAIQARNDPLGEPIAVHIFPEPVWP